MDSCGGGGIFGEHEEVLRQAHTTQGRRYAPASTKAGQGCQHPSPSFERPAGVHHQPPNLSLPFIFPPILPSVWSPFSRCPALPYSDPHNTFLNPRLPSMLAEHERAFDYLLALVHGHYWSVPLVDSLDESWARPALSVASRDLPSITNAALNLQLRFASGVQCLCARGRAAQLSK